MYKLVMKNIIKNELETKELGKKYARDLKGGDIVCLSGELGAGKTTFVKGIAEALGISETIKSPTFTLMNIYHLSTPGARLMHIDTYRLKDESELVAIGIEDYLGLPEVITLIEWPEKISGLLTNLKIKQVNFNHLPDGTREIEI